MMKAECFCSLRRTNQVTKRVPAARVQRFVRQDTSTLLTLPDSSVRVLDLSDTGFHTTPVLNA